jgi:hypothetical protein
MTTLPWWSGEADRTIWEMFRSSPQKVRHADLDTTGSFHVHTAERFGLYRVRCERPAGD